MSEVLAHHHQALTLKQKVSKECLLEHSCLTAWWPRIKKRRGKQTWTKHATEGHTSKDLTSSRQVSPPYNSPSNYESVDGSITGEIRSLMIRSPLTGPRVNIAALEAKHSTYEFWGETENVITASM